MPKRMLIDSSHPEETRVVVLDGNRVEEFDFESASKRPLKGNIYLAKVTRVEPSLQAAFVEYGGNRQGFLAFSEIHPDYYQIPVADRMAILEAQTQRMMAEDDFDAVDTATVSGPASLGTEHAEEQAELSAVRDDILGMDPEHDEASATDEDSDSIESVAREHAETASDVDTETAAAQNIETARIEPAREDRTTADAQSEQVFAPQTTEAAALVSSFSQSAEPEGEFAAEPAREVQTVRAESTGAPASYQRHGPRSDRPRSRRRQYKIQEVIKRRQIMLVQVVKEERGNKGASLTTFLSLAGRYCVLMPNTPRGGGISRKITNASDRKRLKAAAQSLELPEGMGLIIRTAGANRTKLEIKRDYEYLLRLWDSVRELTLKSNAPALVYEEGSLIKRAIRDLYSKDISEVVVDGEGGYREAKDFMRTLMPSHAKNVKPYKEPLPLFQRYHVEAQLDAMFSPVVQLKSCGYVVINQAEALVAIDVNSGKATREHSIEDTAYKTNLEAADEIARQLRLRDLAGLIVIDFIDMEDSKNDRNVEKRLHNAVKGDRARIQIGKISQFGLLEMSRQRLRAGVLAGSTITCPHCNGQGIIRSTESAALRLLRALDEEGQKQPSSNLSVRAPSDVTIYTLNQKRREIARIEEAYDLVISFDPQSGMMGGSFEIERTGVRVPSPRPRPALSFEAAIEEPEAEPDVTIVEAPMETAAAAQPQAQPIQGEGEHGTEGRGRKRRRRRRGGRGRPHGAEFETRGQEPQSAPSGTSVVAEAPYREDADADTEEENEFVEAGESGDTSIAAGPVTGQSGEGAEKRRRRRRRGRRGRRREGEFGAGTPEVAGHVSPVNQAGSEIVTTLVPPDTGDVLTVAPNTPSSPLWSLADQRPERPPLPEVAAQYLATRPMPEPPRATGFAVEVTNMFETDQSFDSTPEPQSSELEALSERDHAPAPQEQPASVEPQAPVSMEETARDVRKGWWQRRFKS